MNDEPGTITTTGGDGGSNCGSISGEPMGETSSGLSSHPSGLLDESDGTCERMLGGSELDSSLRLREIRGNSLQDFQIVEEELQPLVGRYIRGVVRQNIPSTRRYLSDVVLVDSPEERRRLRGWLSGCGPSYPGGLFIWVDEGDHFHIVHDCPWSNGSCRCKWHQEAVSKSVH